MQKSTVFDAPEPSFRCMKRDFALILKALKKEPFGSFFNAANLTVFIFVSGVSTANILTFSRAQLISNSFHSIFHSPLTMFNK